jgi:magnesium-transporting ATPase (P-type)
VRERNLKRRGYIVGMVILIILAAFFRDHIFKAINEQLRINYYKDEYYKYSFLAPVIKSFSSESLNTLKFFLTFLFSGVFMLLCLLLCRIIFRDNTYNRYILITYAIVFFISAGIYLAGKLTGLEDAAYDLSRDISEFLQSPLLILIMVAVFKFDSKRRNSISEH